MSEPKATNVTWHHGHVGRDARQALLRQRGCTLWFTGLSGSGKSTTAYALEHALIAAGHHAYVLDGDNLRHGLNRNLGFSSEDREENIRRVGEVAKLFADSGAIALSAFISPYRRDRAICRALHDTAGVPFLEVYMATPLETCEARDPKGLYRKARSGELKGFTGIDAPYEPPERPEITLDAASTLPADAVAAVVAHLRRGGILLT